MIKRVHSVNFCKQSIHFFSKLYVFRVELNKILNIVSVWSNLFQEQQNQSLLPPPPLCPHYLGQSNSLTVCRGVSRVLSVAALSLWLFRFTLARLYAVLTHRQRSIHTVQFEVETTGIADGFTVVISAPEGRGPGAAICTAETQAACCGLQMGCTLESYSMGQKTFCICICNYSY